MKAEDLIVGDVFYWRLASKYKIIEIKDGYVRYKWDSSVGAQASRDYDCINRWINDGACTVELIPRFSEYAKLMV